MSSEIVIATVDKGTADLIEKEFSSLGVPVLRPTDMQNVSFGASTKIESFRNIITIAGGITALINNLPDAYDRIKRLLDKVENSVHVFVDGKQAKMSELMDMIRTQQKFDATREFQKFNEDVERGGDDLLKRFLNKT